jgi:hypothetical protein
VNRSIREQPLSLGGQKFERGVGTHANKKGVNGKKDNGIVILMYRFVLLSVFLAVAATR